MADQCGNWGRHTSCVKSHGLNIWGYYGFPLRTIQGIKHAVFIVAYLGNFKEVIGSDSWCPQCLKYCVGAVGSGIRPTMSTSAVLGLAIGMMFLVNVSKGLLWRQGCVLSCGLGDLDRSGCVPPCRSKDLFAESRTSHVFELRKIVDRASRDDASTLNYTSFDIKHDDGEEVHELTIVYWRYLSRTILMMLSTFAVDRKDKDYVFIVDSRHTSLRIVLSVQGINIECRGLDVRREIVGKARKAMLALLLLQYRLVAFFCSEKGQMKIKMINIFTKLMWYRVYPPRMDPDEARRGAAKFSLQEIFEDKSPLRIDGDVMAQEAQHPRGLRFVPLQLRARSSEVVVDLLLARPGAARWTYTHPTYAFEYLLLNWKSPEFSQIVSPIQLQTDLFPSYPIHRQNQPVPLSLIRILSGTLDDLLVVGHNSNVGGAYDVNIVLRLIRVSIEQASGRARRRSATTSELRALSCPYIISEYQTLLGISSSSLLIKMKPDKFKIRLIQGPQSLYYKLYKSCKVYRSHLTSQRA
ncbi:hypothetical protein Sjap_008252 [Stephania japonica]|uniref:Uncharacterized protein n=1 Tax=Stephania japonica TaxID=461633 RepID=A0AAP0JQQ4_9MAGN